MKLRSNRYINKPTSTRDTRNGKSDISMKKRLDESSKIYSDASSSTSSNSSSVKKLKCAYCNKKYVYEKSLKKHMEDCKERKDKKAKTTKKIEDKTKNVKPNIKISPTKKMEKKKQHKKATMSGEDLEPSRIAQKNTPKKTGGVAKPLKTTKPNLELISTPLPPTSLNLDNESFTQLPNQEASQKFEISDSIHIPNGEKTNNLTQSCQRSKGKRLSTDPLDHISKDDHQKLMDINIVIPAYEIYNSKKTINLENTNLWEDSPTIIINPVETKPLSLEVYLEEELTVLDISTGTGSPLNLELSTEELTYGNEQLSFDVILDPEELDHRPATSIIGDSIDPKLPAPIEGNDKNTRDTPQKNTTLEESPELNEEHPNPNIPNKTLPLGNLLAKNTVINTKLPDLEVTSKLICPYCPEDNTNSYKKDSYLSSHIKLEHTDRYKEYMTKQSYCNICNKQYATRGAYTNHYKARHQESHITCEYCLLKFSNKNLLNKHMKDKHETEYVKPKDSYKCDECNHMFGNHGAYITHMKHRHNSLLNKENISVETSKSESNLRKCPDCEATYKAESNLTKHRIRCHKYIPGKSEQNNTNHIHVCQYRSQGYTKRSSLSKHYSKEHSEEYIFKEITSTRCTRCNREFENLHAIRTHYVKRHSTLNTNKDILS